MSFYVFFHVCKHPSPCHVTTSWRHVNYWVRDLSFIGGNPAKRKRNRRTQYLSSERFSFYLKECSNIGLQFLASAWSFEKRRFSWKAQHFSVKSAPSWKVQCFSVKSAAFHEERSAFHHANLWALGLSPSIGLSSERPNSFTMQWSLEVGDTEEAQKLLKLPIYISQNIQ